ncbi:Putative uncharacterized protein [Moritella viscosa]|uniref:Ig-like domain-containing protein n=1 Tax=Moritella viscosa TaxID=80854 RepID=UPI0009183B59|nr:Ig-like domain-containing protein [Moritella viscosa]SGZ04857.1 Putative uncharacterized protein [Moritella viscosa]
MNTIRMSFFIAIILSLAGCEWDDKLDVNKSDINEPDVKQPIYITGHYYDKGHFDKSQNYENAFSNNFTEENVEIHSYVVIEFDNEVDPVSITDSTVQIKRLHMEDTPFADSELNNNNIISGNWVLSTDNKSLTFKPAYKPYLDRSTFAYYTESKPNWNGLKPGYEYQVTISESIKSADGAVLSTPAKELTWTFKTTDVDYGLYWFKNSTDAVKYIPGREIDKSYYAPENDTLIYAHGWQQESVVADYRREGFNHFVNSETSGFSSGMTETMDLVSIWKDKSWNFGAFYWNQIADDDDNAKSSVGAAVPYKAESKIWNTIQMRYAVSPYSLTGSARQDKPIKPEDVWEYDRQDVNNPIKPMSVILAEILESALDEMDDNEFRLAGHSLGSQMVHGAAYILSENKNSAALIPDRLALIDPYWAGANVADDYWDEHPAKALVTTATEHRDTDREAALATGLSGYYNPGYSGQPWNEEINRSIAEQLALDNVAIAFYDVSSTSDGFSGVSGVYYGGLNTPERDIAAISYLKTPWIHTNEYKKLGQKHVNGRLWYLWQMAFDAKDISSGFSASTTTDSLIDLMNAKKTEKGRWIITAGQSTATPEDDVFELSHEQKDLGNWWSSWHNSKSWQE